MMTDILIISNDDIFKRMLELELKAAGYTVAFGKNMPMFDSELDCAVCVAELLNTDEVLPRVKLACNRLIIISNGYSDNYTVFSRPFNIRNFVDDIGKKYSSYRDGLTVKPKGVNLSIADELVIDENLRSVSFRNDIISLTGREFDLLLYLYRKRGIPVDRNEAVRNVWKYNFAGDTNVVDVYIRYLREKIDEKYNVKLIYTVRNKGYMIK